MRIRRILVYFILIVFFAIWMLPLLSLILTCLKSEEQILYLPFWSFPSPSEIHFWENVATAWMTLKLSKSFFNTLIYSSISPTVAVFLASLIAFPLTKMKFRRKNTVFYLALIGTFLPFQMYLIPDLKILAGLKLFNTKIGLILVYTSICIPFATILIRNYMLTLPDWLLDAAKLDGLSYFGIYRKVILPLSTPALVVAFLFQFIWVWNEMLFGMVLTHSHSTRPLMTQLAMLKGSYITSFGVMAAGSVISIIVPVILVLVFQKRFTQGFIAPSER